MNSRPPPEDLPAKSGDAGAVEVSVDLPAAAAERVADGDLRPFWRVPLLLLRHGATWVPLPLVVAGAMAAIALGPGGLAGLLQGRIGSVATFLAVFPALIWATLLVGVDLAGVSDSVAARMTSRGRALADTAPLLAAQLAWLVPAPLLAAMGVVPELLFPATLLGLFYAGFSSFFVLAARRLEGRSRPGAFLGGHRRALRALLLWPVDLSAHGLVVGERQGEGLLDCSEGTLALHALGTVAAMLVGACLGLLVWPGHHGFWWGSGPSLGDALFAALATLGFVGAAQVGAGLTAYEYAALLAAERGLLPPGGWRAIRVRTRQLSRAPDSPGEAHSPR